MAGRWGRSGAAPLHVEGLNLLEFPAAAVEEDGACYGDGSFSDHDGDEDAVGLQVGGDGQDIGQRESRGTRSRRDSPMVGVSVSPAPLKAWSMTMP